MKTSKEIEVGARYTCRFRGRDRVCRVREVDTSGYARHSTVRIVADLEVLEEKGSRNELPAERAVFRSPSRLLARLGEPIHGIKWAVTPQSSFETVAERNALITRLMKALGHLPHDWQLAVVASWMRLEDLRRCVEFQEREA